MTDISSPTPEQTNNKENNSYVQEEPPDVLNSFDNSSNKNFKLKVVVIAAAVILLVLVFTAIAIIFKPSSSKFSSYTIQNGSKKYSLLFYSNSTIQNKTIGNNVINTITSPVTFQDKYPVVILFETRNSISANSLKQTVTTSSNCDTSFGGGYAFSITIPGLGETANFCDYLGLDYYSDFGNNTQYLLQIQFKLPNNYSSIQDAIKSGNSTFLSNRLNTNDIKTIVSSIKVIK